MTTYARIANGAVAELFTPPDGVAIGDCFHVDLIWIGITGHGGVVPGWTYDGTTFAAPDGMPPVSAQGMLETKVALGIAITCTGNATLDATYALDAVTLDQIASVARDSASGLGLPGGLTTFTYPDASSTPRMFNAAQLIALYKAMRDLMLALNTQTAVMANGGTPVWPAQSATIA